MPTAGSTTRETGSVVTETITTGCPLSARETGIRILVWWGRTPNLLTTYKALSQLER